MSEDKKLKKPTEQAPSASESTPGRWESEEEWEEFNQQLAQDLVDNLNENVLKEDQEKESEEKP